MLRFRVRRVGLWGLGLGGRVEVQRQAEGVRKRLPLADERVMLDPSRSKAAACTLLMGGRFEGFLAAHNGISG